MATLTGKNLLDSIIDSTGASVNALIYNTLSARLQQLIDNGLYSKMTVALALKGFSIDINEKTPDVSALMDTVEGNKQLIEAAADDAAVALIDFPDYGGEAPISYELTADDTAVKEGNTLTFTVTASEAVTEDTEVVFNINALPESESVSGKATTSDFAAGAMDPVTVVIKAGETQASFDVTPSVDADEDPETFGVTAMVAGETLNLEATILGDDAPKNDFKLESKNGGDVMRITGDQAQRIDFTNPDNQITGQDLNGDSEIARDGVENNIHGVASNFIIVDAYARNPLNIYDHQHNFLGDIEFDGTGFAGDGVSTDGNIFLGGLGNDTAFGGIGNDFLAGGMGDDNLYGGRNADFFFQEKSTLSPTDDPTIKGGETVDNLDAQQDRDWLLLEASDDEDGREVKLDGNNELEALNASGNLFGFLNNIDVELGARVTDSRIAPHVVGQENFSIGTTAQLIVDGNGENNVIIAGYDNDVINGKAGDDILFGGDMQFNQTYKNNANILDITNDGKDVILAGDGDDHILFEMDGGEIQGDAGEDTLWLTDYSGGTKDSAASKTSDGVVRIDLLGDSAGKSAGYGGADVEGTVDQSNYINTNLRNTTTNIENVIATGLGAIDFDIYGNNVGNLSTTVQNYFGITDAKLDLRGTDKANILYANTNDDVLEGREGNDSLSGGLGNDDFIFQLKGNGDGLDTIHRQADADGNNIWDLNLDAAFAYTADFGKLQDQNDGVSYLYAQIPSSVDLTNANVGVTQFQVRIDGVDFGTDLTASDLSGCQTTAELAAVINASFNAQDSRVTVEALSAEVLAVKVDDPAAVIGQNLSEGTVMAGTAVGSPFQVNVLTAYDAGTLAGDRLVFASYEDRDDGELVDDDGFVNETGDAVTLGADAYAEDLVVRFDADGEGTTVLAEDQEWSLEFKNFADEDTLTISVNGTSFSLQMGVAADGTAIAETQAQFLQRMCDLINAGADDDTLAGSVKATFAAPDTIALTQDDYYGGQVAFMDEPEVTIGNASGGESASVEISQPNTDSQITLFQFDGRDNALNNENVLFLGGSGMNEGKVTDAGNSRSVLATAADEGGELKGSDALILDSMTDADTNATDFSLHGDDLLFTGVGNDVVTAGTGDDRIFGSAGTDTVDGGKDLWVVKKIVGGVAEESVEALNDYEATSKLTDPEVVNVSLLEEDTASGATNGFVDQLIFSTNDFADNTQFVITASNDITQEHGGEGVVGVDEGRDGIINHTTTFTEMEAIRTLAGDGTHAGQGTDTLDVNALSYAVEATKLNDKGTWVRYNMTSDLGYIAIHGDFDGDGVADDEINEFLAVDGVENLIGGNADDTLNIDESEVNKDNRFEGGNEVDDLDAATIDYGDKIVYDHSDMDNDGNNDVASGDSAAIAMRPSATVTIESASETDTVAFTGGTVVGSDVTTDTLVDVETIDLNDAASSMTLDDTLDVSHINGATVDFVNEVVTNSAGKVLARIDDMSQLEVTQGSSSNDRVIVANDMENAREEAATAANNDFTFFGASKINQMKISNQNLYKFNFDEGVQDTIDYRNETDDDLVAVVDFEGVTDKIIVTDDQDNSLAEVQELDLTGASVAAGQTKASVTIEGVVIDLAPGADSAAIVTAIVAQSAAITAANNNLAGVAADATGDKVVFTYNDGLADYADVVVASANVSGMGNVKIEETQKGVREYAEEEARVDLVNGADRFYAGGDNANNDYTIDVSQVAGDVNIVFSQTVNNESERLIQITNSESVPFAKQFVDDGLTDAEKAAAVAYADLPANGGNGNGALDPAEEAAYKAELDKVDAYWDRIEGGNSNEKISLSDRESNHNIIMNLQGGTNVVEYNRNTLATTLKLEDVLAVGADTPQQKLTVETDDNDPTIDGSTDTITGDKDSLRIVGSQTGSDLIDMQAVSSAYSIQLNIKEGASLIGYIDQTADETLVSVKNRTTVSGYEDIAGNSKDNTYELNKFVNNVYMGDGDDILNISDISDIEGDTIVGDYDVNLATTKENLILGNLTPARMIDGEDTIVIKGDLIDGTYTFDFNDGTSDQFTAGPGNTASIFGFEHFDASASADADDVFDLTTHEVVASTLRGGAGDDTLTIAATSPVGVNHTLDGGAGADTIALLATGTATATVVYQSGDSNVASRDMITDFVTTEDTIQVDVNIADIAGEDLEVTWGAVLAAGKVNANYVGGSALEVDIDADGTLEATGDLTIGSAGNIVAADMIFNITGTDAENNIVGGAGNDTINGGAGNDTITAGAGADTITGGAGNDTINMDAGSADTLVFEADATANGADTIDTFVPAEDKLDFRAFVTGRAVDSNGAAQTGASTFDEFSTGSAGEIDISDKVATFDNGGTALTDATLAAEFAVGESFAAATTKAVVLSGDVGGANPVQIWYVDNSLDGDATTMTAADVKLVGTITAFDLDTIQGADIL